MTKPFKQKKVNLYKREWMRGYIIGAEIHGVFIAPITLKMLEKEYAEYLKKNPLPTNKKKKI